MRQILLPVIALVIATHALSAWSAECSGAMPWRSAAAASAGYSDAALSEFYDLSKKASAAYAGGNAAARRLAEQYLAMASRFPCDWNYGNAIHNANSILGLLALSDSRTTDAVRCLRAAGSTPGSPQLDTFGPSLLLASRLAAAGEYKEVASYLVSVRRFWKAKDMSPIGLLIPYFQDPDPIASWIKELNDGRVPDFGAPFNTNPP